MLRTPGAERTDLVERMPASGRKAWSSPPNPLTRSLIGERYFGTVPTGPYVCARIRWNATNTGTSHSFVLPGGIEPGSTVLLAITVHSSLASDPPTLTVDGATVTRYDTRLTASGFSLDVYAFTATSTTSGATCVYSWGTTGGSNLFRIAVAGVAVVGIDATPTQSSRTAVGTASTKTAPTIGSAAAGTVELSIVADVDSATPVTAYWSPPSGVTREALGVYSRAAAGVTAAVGSVLTPLTSTGSIGGRTWGAFDTTDTANANSYGAAWTLGFPVSTAPSPAGGTAAVSLTATGAAESGAASASGTASLSLTASGTARAPASGSASLALTASGTARAAATGTAAVTVTATGTAAAPATATASVQLDATGTATGGVAPSGTASVSITATGTARAASTGTASVLLTATGTATAPTTATASVVVTATGAARAAASGTAAVVLTATGTAAGVAPTSGTAAVLLTASGSTAAAATGTASVVVTATATARAALTGGAAVELVATGVAEAAIVITRGLGVLTQTPTATSTLAAAAAPSGAISVALAASATLTGRPASTGDLVHTGTASSRVETS